MKNIRSISFLATLAITAFLLGVSGAAILRFFPTSAGTIASTLKTYSQIGITRVDVYCVSDSSGAVNQPIVGLTAGTLKKVQFIPDSGGTKPTNLFDVTVLDSVGEDILTGLGSNVTTATLTTVAPFVGNLDLSDGWVGPEILCEDSDSGHTVVAAHCGDSKGFTMRFFLSWK